MITDVRPSEQRVERLLDQDLAGAVDVRGRLVEDQDPRVGEQRARDRDQLPLAGREARAALADDVVEPALEPGRDPVDADRVRGGGDLLVGRLGAPEADVVRDRAAEQERVLEDDPELAPDRPQLHVAEIDAVDAHRALERVVEARDQLRGRRLAAAGLADERDAASRGHVDRDAVDDRLVAVGEDDVVELEVALDAADLGRARA